MKGALILARDADFFSQLVESLVVNGLIDGPLHRRFTSRKDGRAYNGSILTFAHCRDMLLSPKKCLKLDLHHHIAGLTGL